MEKGEPTRVGSFDDEMFYKLAESLAISAISKGLSNLSEKLYGFGIDEQVMTGAIYEFREKQITDSHDISKSDFGFNEW